MSQQKITQKEVARKLYAVLKETTNSVQGVGSREKNTIVVYLRWDTEVPETFLGFNVVKEITPTVGSL
jgi:hypothetical protein